MPLILNYLNVFLCFFIFFLYNIYILYKNIYKIIYIHTKNDKGGGVQKYIFIHTKIYKQGHINCPKMRHICIIFGGKKMATKRICTTVDNQEWQEIKTKKYKISELIRLGLGVRNSDNKMAQKLVEMRENNDLLVRKLQILAQRVNSLEHEDSKRSIEKSANEIGKFESFQK